MDAVRPDPRMAIVGIERAMPAAASSRGAWLTLASGEPVWRLRLSSSGATGLRVQFLDFQVGDGKVWIYSADRSQVVGPYTGSGIDATGNFWSNTVFSDTVVIEYEAATAAEVVPFAIGGVSHYITNVQTLSAGSCELDVSCYPDWATTAPSVGMYMFQSGGATYACSGSLVNNTKNDNTPYFLTANHCVSTAAAAGTVEVFWKDQTPACNGQAPSLSGLPTSLGATFMAGAGISSGDFSLLKLTALPNASLQFLGWNASATALPVSANAIGIHHPQADYTRISFGVRTNDQTAQIGSDTAPANLFYQIQETSGVVEPGSSGSPLFTPDHLIVGTLTYGPGGNACTISPFTAGYARFSNAYLTLSTYLAPGSGSGTAPPPPAPVTVSASPATVSASWTTGAAAPAALAISISTSSTAAISLSLQPSQPWLTVSATTVSASAAKPASFTITYKVTSFTAVGMYLGTIAVSGASAPITIPVAVTVTAAGAASGGQVTVIPLVLDGPGFATSITLANPYATSTVASIAFFGPTGAAVAMPTGQSQPVTSQNLTIPAYGSATVATTGTSSTQKQAFALIQTSDPAKRISGIAQINQDLIAPAIALAPPFAVPFDATTSATTMLYLYNPAWSGSVALSLAIYDTSGNSLATGQISIPAGQESAITMSKTSAGFGGKKGTVIISGSAGALALGIRIGTDNRLETVLPQATH